MANAANVPAFKPNPAGAVYYGPITLAAPTSATADLPVGLLDVGYISDEGVTNANGRTSEDVKAWGGDTVLSTQTEKTDRFTFTMLEVLNVNVLKAVHGEENVSGTLETGISVKVNAKELDYHMWIIDMILKGGVLQRMVIPNAKIVEVADVTYTDSGATGYQVTLSAEPDAGGDTHHEYTVKP